MDIEKAKENLRIQLAHIKEVNECGLATKGEFKEDIEAVETVLEELDKKDKIIDEMAKAIYDYANLEILIECPAEYDEKFNLENCKMNLADRNCPVCIKQYFKKKVEERSC